MSANEQDRAASIARCPGCGNVLGGDNLCMVSACQWEGVEPTYVAPEALIRETLLALLEVVRIGATNLDRERELANDERQPLLRQYRLGLVDGIDETLKALVAAVPAELTALATTQGESDA